MIRRLAIRSPLHACVAVLCTACVSLSPGAVAGLAGFDPFSADPAAIAVAVRTTQALRLRTGDVTLRVALAADDPVEAFDETFRLAIIADGQAAGVVVEPGSGESVHVASVAAQDRDRLAAVQAKVRAYKAAGRPAGRGTLTVAVTGGCRTRPIDAAAARLTTYMRTAADRPFFALTREQPLRKALAGVALDRLPDCRDAGQAGAA